MSQFISLNSQTGTRSKSTVNWTKQLQAGNALIQGTAHLSLLVGPLVAGLLVSWLDGGAGHSSSGIALAIAIDSLSFLASVAVLSLIKIEHADARGKSQRRSLSLHSRRSALRLE